VFPGGSLNKLVSAAESAGSALTQLKEDAGLRSARIGIETGEYYEPATYASMHFYQGRRFDHPAALTTTAALLLGPAFAPAPVVDAFAQRFHVPAGLPWLLARSRHRDS
jgi:hypothetical protein